MKKLESNPNLPLPQGSLTKREEGLKPRDLMEVYVDLQVLDSPIEMKSTIVCIFPKQSNSSDFWRCNLLIKNSLAQGSENGRAGYALVRQVHRAGSRPLVPLVAFAQANMPHKPL